mmetsp:Transcript_3290/g.6800  ORF Transcript_3290/g.6800 Transcript_3290/m.6800 type:complete len:218 (+) Transcript_3290:2985-3638(+)
MIISSSILSAKLASTPVIGTSSRSVRLLVKGCIDVSSITTQLMSSMITSSSCTRPSQRNRASSHRRWAMFVDKALIGPLGPPSTFFLVCLLKPSTKLTTSWLDMTSQTPSDAITANKSRSKSRVNCWMTGVPITPTDLARLSPMDRDIASPGRVVPGFHTLYGPILWPAASVIFCTTPPMSCILFISSSKLGFWSRVSARGTIRRPGTTIRLKGVFF